MGRTLQGSPKRMLGKEHSKGRNDWVKGVKLIARIVDSSTRIKVASLFLGRPGRYTGLRRICGNHGKIGKV
jgi:hypothetical protein